MKRKIFSMILASVIGTAVLCGCDNVMNAGTTEDTHEENNIQADAKNTEKDIKKDTEKIDYPVQEEDKKENCISESVVKKEADALEKNSTASELPLLSRVDSWPEETVEIVPYDTEMTGAVGGYFFIPMENGIYRYSDYDYSVQAMIDQGFDLETDELIYTCKEAGAEESYTWEIYSLNEYPDKSLLLADCVGFDSQILLSYAPCMACDEDALEDAKENDFVIMTNGSVTDGKEIWQDFISDVENGQPAVVRLGYCYTLDEDKVSPELFEAEKMDYPAIFFNQLYYDGSDFTLSPVNKLKDEYVIYEKPQISKPEASYSFLMHYAGDASFDFQAFSAYDKYVLTNDDQVTWEQLFQSETSSLSDAYIPHEEVYCEYTWKCNHIRCH